jgi:hypothetical protein
MEFEIGKAVVGGLVGTIAMTMAMAMGSMMGMKMDMPMMLGTMLLPKGTAARVAGLMLHLMMGIVFFIIYAAIFNGLNVESAIVGWSALSGAVHAIVAGAGMGMMPALHPRMATAPGPGLDKLPAPGFFGIKMGKMAPMAIVGVHVAFGLVAGAIYAA